MQEHSPQESAVDRQAREAKQERDSTVVMLAAAIYVFNDATDADAPSRAINRAEAFIAEAARRGMKLR